MCPSNIMIRFISIYQKLYRYMYQRHFLYIVMLSIHLYVSMWANSYVKPSIDFFLHIDTFKSIDFFLHIDTFKSIDIRQSVTGKSPIEGSRRRTTTVPGARASPLRTWPGPLGGGTEGEDLERPPQINHGTRVRPT